MSTGPVDFLQKRRTPRVGWVLLAAGLAAAAWAYSRDRAADAADAARTLRESQRAEAVQQARAQAAAASRMTPERLRAQGARLEVAVPWSSVLDALASASKDPVYVLSVSLDPSRASLHIDGEAPDLDHAVSYVEGLAATPPLREVRLASHEQVGDAGSGRQVVRFAVDARWSDAP